MIFISPFELLTITPFVQECTLIPFGVMDSFVSLNVFGTIEVVAPESTQTSSLSVSASSAKRLLDSQLTYFLALFFWNLKDVRYQSVIGTFKGNFAIR